MSKSTPEFSIRVEQNGEATVLSLKGEVDLHSSPSLRARLQTLLDQQRPRIVIDLADVSYMDSSGVGTIVEAKRRADREGGKIVLAALQQRVRSVFEITQLDKFFTIVASRDEALEA